VGVKKRGGTAMQALLVVGLAFQEMKLASTRLVDPKNSVHLERNVHDISCDLFADVK
jgi:hypothetical protein